MRSFILGSIVALTAVGMVAFGCSKDVEDDGEGGNTSVGGSTSSGGGGVGGGTSGCTEITSDDFAYLGAGLFGLPYYYGGAPNPALGGADEDAFYYQVYDPELTGTVDLGAGDQANFETCTACVMVLEDLPEEGDPVRFYFQQTGTLELGSSLPYYISGSFTDVTLVEVTLDEETGASTPVDGGQCLHITSLAFDIQPPAAGWTCDPNYYDGGVDDGCDCGCGVLDPDCNLSGVDIYGCYEGQTCSAASECEGTPTAWTCDPGDFDGGNDCHCGCGVPDPDCDSSSTIVGCTTGFTCNVDSGVCVDDAWTCDAGYYDDGAFCDCDCGVYDPDCEDENNSVYNCDDPGETGVCLTDGTCELE